MKLRKRNANINTNKHHGTNKEEDKIKQRKIKRGKEKEIARRIIADDTDINKIEI